MGGSGRDGGSFSARYSERGGSSSSSAHGSRSTCGSRSHREYRRANTEVLRETHMGLCNHLQEILPDYTRALTYGLGQVKSAKLTGEGHSKSHYREATKEFYDEQRKTLQTCGGMTESHKRGLQTLALKDKILKTRNLKPEQSHYAQSFQTPPQDRMNSALGMPEADRHKLEGNERQIEKRRDIPFGQNKSHSHESFRPPDRRYLNRFRSGITKDQAVLMDRNISQVHASPSILQGPPIQNADGPLHPQENNFKTPRAMGEVRSLSHLSFQWPPQRTGNTRHTLPLSANMNSYVDLPYEPHNAELGAKHHAEIVIRHDGEFSSNTMHKDHFTKLSKNEVLKSTRSRQRGGPSAAHFHSVRGVPDTMVHKGNAPLGGDKTARFQDATEYNKVMRAPNSHAHFVAEPELHRRHPSRHHPSRNQNNEKDEDQNEAWHIRPDLVKQEVDPKPRPLRILGDVDGGRSYSGFKPGANRTKPGEVTGQDMSRAVPAG